MNNSDKENSANILRTEDIVPPYNKDVSKRQHLQKIKANQNKEILSENELNEFLDNDDSSLAEENMEEIHSVTEIPKFDLAEQIMAEQRRTTSVRRKPPGQRSKNPSPRNAPDDYFIKQPPVVLSQQQQIIADIVARDIEKFCRESSSHLGMHDF